MTEDLEPQEDLPPEDEAGDVPEPEDEPGEGEETDEEVAPASPEESAEVAAEFVTGLLEAMELQGTVGTSVDAERAVVEIEGDDLGVLIGRRGQTLDALQEIVRTAVQRRLKSRVRLVVDVEGYRARRRSSLAEYAQSMAQRALERGTEIELEPMSAYERKIVHDAVAEVPGAVSFSEGEEPDRKVIVRGE